MSNKEDKNTKKIVTQEPQKPKEETRLMINVSTSKNSKGRFSEVEKKKK